MTKIGVGIIGASPDSWAAISHIPALKALPEYDLRAISTSRRESAEASARKFDVPASFDNHLDLLDHPGIDLVVVAVKVPHHHELISAAIDAGKMVYSEWPFANGMAEAIDLTNRAEAAGVRTAIGLQARYSPEISHARDLIRDGYLGQVLGTTLVGSAAGWGPQTDLDHAYTYDQRNGSTTLTVAMMHALDPMHYLLGEFASVTANLITRRTQVTLVENGAGVPVTAADQVAVIGTLCGGAAVSAFYRGGLSRGDNLRWEINGTDGDLVLTAPNGNIQLANLTLAGGRGQDTTVAKIPAPHRYSAQIPDALAGPPHNIAQAYKRLARDVEEGTRTVPDFAHGLARHRLIDAIERASSTGSLQGVL